MIKLSLFFLTAIFLISCSTSQSNSVDMKLLQDITLTTTSDAYLLLGSPAGKVKVTTWDKEEVNVKIYGDEYTTDQMAFDIKKQGMDVSVTGKIKDETEGHNNLRVRYEIIVPKQYNIEANTKGGNIDVTDLNGTKNLNTMGGSIKVEKGDGSLNANTMGGNIHLNMSNGKVKANTMGGNISLDYTGTNNGIDLNTMGGNIHVTLPVDFNGDADITTMAGKISCDFAEPERDFASSSLKAKFNNGGETIKITTSAGNIHVEKNK